MDFWLQKLFIHDLFHSPSDAIATNVGCWIMHHIASPGGLGYSLHCGGNEQEQRCFRLVPSLHSGTNTTFVWRDGRNNGPVLAYQFETKLLFPFIRLLDFVVRRTSMAKTSDLLLSVIAFISQDLQQTFFQNNWFHISKTPIESTTTHFLQKESHL